MDWTSFVVGILGTLVGTSFSFIFKLFEKRSEKTFTMTVEIRKSMIDLYEGLTNAHTEILKMYYDSGDSGFANDVILLKPQLDKLMELYKMYRIHLGDLKIYEVQSSICNRYYEIAIKSIKGNSNEDLTKADFEEAYRALKDAYGVLINELRFSLVEINSVKKLRREDKRVKEVEYTRYANRVIKSLDSILKPVIIEYNKEDELLRKNMPQHRLMVRINAFIDEYTKRGGSAHILMPNLIINKEI